MNWIMGSVEEGIVKNFKYFETAKELSRLIKAAYAQKRNNARILELTIETAPGF